MSDPMAMLLQLADDPTDETTRAVLADLFDEAGPTPVERGKVPLWLLRRWTAQVPKDLRQHADRRGTMYTRRDLPVWMEQRTRWPTIDHWGCTILAGLPCFVTEPYRDASDAPGLFADIPDLLEVVHGFARCGHWRRSTIRGILFPITLWDARLLHLNSRTQSLPRLEGLR